MAGLLDLFGGSTTDPGALYGGLLSPDQKSALAYRGLLAAAGAPSANGYAGPTLFDRAEAAAAEPGPKAGDQGGDRRRRKSGK